MFMCLTLHRLLDTNCHKHQSMLGRLWCLRKKERFKRICESMPRNPQRSTNKMAAEENVRCRTTQVVINEDLIFRLYR